MPRYKVMTPDTPHLDFEQTTEVESIVCVRHLLERWQFAGCTVWRRKHNHWSAIFDTSGPQGDYSDPPAVWKRVEASQ